MNMRAIWKFLKSGRERITTATELRKVGSLKTARLRILFLGSCLSGLLFLFLLRYAYLSVVPTEIRATLLSKDNRQHAGTTALSTPRAPIVDRLGRALALTIFKPSVFIVPQRIPENSSVLKQLSQKSGVPQSRLRRWKNDSRRFAWLKRQTTAELLAQFEAIPGWDQFGGSAREPTRVYPHRSLAAQVIGFTGIDNQGLAGIEAVYEERLKGEIRNAQVTRDARRRLSVTFPNQASQPEVQKPPLVLSLDLEVQRILEKELLIAQKVSKSRAAGGIVLDSQTGEIFAMASLPTFDLNNLRSKNSASARNRPIQDALELGSVLKPAIVAAALNEGVIKPNDRVDCEGGSLRLPGATINDTKKNGILTIEEILRKSSNVCMYKIAKRLGREKMADYLNRFGLTTPPGTGLPGEFSGQELNPAQWREIRFANIAFGQGIAISQLQLVRALATTIGSGERLPLRILKGDIASGSSPNSLQDAPARVVSPEVAHTLRGMLATLVDSEEATVKTARLEAHTAGGKTGTAEKFSAKTRSYSERTSNFIGFFPAEHPRFLIHVMLDEVQVRPAWGGKLAAPVFAAVANQLSRYLEATGQLSLYKRAQPGKGQE